MSAGRAQRARLERRLATARRGAELLDRKRRILLAELEAAQDRADRAVDAWEGADRAAALSLGRALAIAGADRLVRVVADPCVVSVTWETVLGISVPAEVRRHVAATATPTGSPAVQVTVGEHRAALDAAVVAAASRRRVELLGVELAATRARQRAVERRWVPRLEARLAAVRHHLAQDETEEALRPRWAAGARPQE